MAKYVVVRQGKEGDNLNIRFGPAGIGPVRDSVTNLERYHNLGLKSCEIAFTYGIYIKKDNDMISIKNAAQKFDITLSVHAPYWINLNSLEQKKIIDSKKRIIDCCKIGEKLGAYLVVFHPGYFGKMSREITYKNIKNIILEIQEEIEKNNWNIKIAPETSGKVNVFGSIDDISNLVEDTKCSFCLDFAHIKARDKNVDWNKLKEKFGKFKFWHCHFSGIIYGEKGERSHIITSDESWKKLILEIKENCGDKDVIIINESPDPVMDSVNGFNTMKTLYSNFEY